MAREVSVGSALGWGRRLDGVGALGWGRRAGMGWRLGYGGRADLVGDAEVEHDQHLLELLWLGG